MAFAIHIPTTTTPFLRRMPALRAPLPPRNPPQRVTMHRCSPLSTLGLAVGLAFSVHFSAADSPAHAAMISPPAPIAALLHHPFSPPSDTLHVSAAGPSGVLTTPSDLTDRPVSDLKPLHRTYDHLKDEASPPEKKPLSQRISDKLRSRGLPDELVVFLVSALPAVELRAGIPVGFVLNMHPLKTLLLAVLGNLAPILPLMLILRVRFVQALAARVLDRARKKAAAVGNANSRAVALALFVGVPLPGTGAWTGSLVAFVLGMPFGQSFAALAAGVVMAASIMTVLCALGKVGALVAGTLLVGMGVSSVFRGGVGASEDEGKTEEAVEGS